MRLFEKAKDSKGFSLVELLVVATIVGLLAAAGMVSYTTANRASRDAKRKADLEKVRAALELYRIEEGCYPGSTQATCLEADGASMETVLSELESSNGSGNQYISNTVDIKDPKASNDAYVFNSSSANCSAYCMCAETESPTNANSDDNDCSFDDSGNETHYCVCNP